jgi:hypothetical protein
MSEHLRALALAATPGPWGRDACRITAKELGWARVADTEFDNDSMAENAAFIAAANPAAILALLDELEDSHKAYELLFKENAELRKDAERLDWVESQALMSRTGVSFDYVRLVEDGLVVEKGFRVMQHRHTGGRTTSIRSAIDSAAKGESNE